MAMNPEIKATWIEALLSGKYKQTRQTLRRSEPDAGGRQMDSYCCLGVLCELAVEEGVIDPPQPFEGPIGGKRWMYGRATSVALLPREVMDWAGLVENNPTAGDFSLSHYNDRGKSFESIAQIIEEYL